MSGQPPSWYLRRLARMSPGELVWRGRDHARKVRWRSHQVRAGWTPALPPSALPDRLFGARLPPDVRAFVPAGAVDAVVAAADAVLAGRLDVLGVERDDVAAPDWFLDPVTGVRSAPHTYAFGVNQRSETEVGNVKQVWELSRHHHLTQLAAAWFLTGEARYAERVREQLTSWWRENPFLSGVHWTSGIELGIRLISWTWVRRLLDGWPGVAELFELNPAAAAQIHWHQRYLAAFRSRGSSANNHVIAEAAGQLTAACAFPWFAESARWRSDAARLLDRELSRNVFPDGVDRELASEYHGFVAELGLLAAVEAEAAGVTLGARTWPVLTGMLDAAAALVDETLRPPRQGDGDDGRTLVVDPVGEDASWAPLLALGGAVVPPLSWWPKAPADARSTLVGALLPAAARTEGGDRPAQRPSRFPASGVTVLRTGSGREPEIWCRCDGGPHGFLSIAAHAHADALSVELRVGGVDVLADPGTYCYHGEPEWREYFRSTLGHNTLRVAGVDQSASGGPFLWHRHANGRLTYAATADDDVHVTWCAEHDGYRALRPPAGHRRRVRLDRASRVLEIDDTLTGASGRDVTLAYHLGPAVTAELRASTAALTWPTGAATVTLPGVLDWTAHRGETGPVLGWYSPAFGRRVPATTLLGTGSLAPGVTLRTVVNLGVSTSGSIPLVRRTEGDERTGA